jgi:2-polyprenyl-6-methoxyphenol hydroxylase-like FAD-dependent oxidoreductase
MVNRYDDTDGRWRGALVVTAGNNGSAIIVGGSLNGLASAIALARAGVVVTVVEQNEGMDRIGTGLGVDRPLLSMVTGVDATRSGKVPMLPVVRSFRETSTWRAIYTWLRSVADITGGIEIREGLRVDAVTQDAAHAQVQGNGFAFEADIVVGADGYRSRVRRIVDPANPIARYGGFVIWRGLVEEAWVEGISANLRGGRMPYADTARLVAYAVPGPDGRSARGERQITYAWYDASRTEWLRDNGFLDGEEILASVPPEAISPPLRNELRTLAMTRWRSPERDVLVAALDRGILFGTPLTEYIPAKLYSGRIAMVGDAAHVASPMVGAGLVNGLLDALALGRAVGTAGGTRGAAGAGALRAYEAERLEDNRAHVEESIGATVGLLRSITRR